MTLSSAIGSLPSWHRDAACGPLGKLWASKHPLDVERQRKVCAGCPALHRCAADAAGKRKDELPDLVVAGLTRAEHLAGGLADAPRECSQCHETKPLSDFYARKRGKGGRSSKCKTCENARQRAAYQGTRRTQAGRLPGPEEEPHGRINRMSGSMDEQFPPYGRKKKPRRIDGKRVVKHKKKTPQLPRHQVVVSEGVVTVVEGYGVTDADLASARAMALGLAVASTGGV